MVEVRAEYVLYFELFALKRGSTSYSGMIQILLQHCNLFHVLLYDLAIMPGRSCQPADMFPSLKQAVDLIRDANSMELELLRS